MSVRVNRPPVNVAFDVFARHAGRIRGGERVRQRGERRVVRPAHPGISGRRREGGRDPAERRTGGGGRWDLYEIWKGEIAYSGLAVKAE